MRKRRQIQATIIIVVAVLLCIFIGSSAAMRGYVNKTEADKISDNVFVGHTDVSGMTEAQAVEALNRELQNDSSITITMNVLNGSVEAFLKEIGYGCPDVEKLAKEALDYGKKGSMWKRYKQIKALEKEPHEIEELYSIDEKKLKALLDEKATPLLQLAENAYIDRDCDTGETSIVEEKEGETIDFAKSVEVIEKAVNGKWDHKAFDVDLATKLDKPEIVKEDLEDMTDALGSFYTDAGGGERWTNLKTGSGKINGTIVEPGETFSMYDTVAPFNEENGYAEGTAYENGQVVPSWGGGICQVSTTLYNAVIYAELEIVERYPHSMLVDYVKPSRDAAIAGGSMDFRFKNSYDTPIYIFSEIDDYNQLRVVIYGKETRPENRRVEYESETISTEEYSTEYRINTELSFGEMKYTGSPHTGCDARLWKIVYEDDEQVSKEIFNTSSYQKSNQIIEIGTAGGSADAIAALEDAVARQSLNEINAAINAAYGQGSEEE